MSISEKETIDMISKNFTHYHFIVEPSLPICLAYLRSRATKTMRSTHLDYIPKKYKTFCKIQMKLEGIDIDE
ncbi:MAG: hypothetical protein OEZ01_04310 [Candidatus Heimdallarchaeota archaeon]|nr:hypothetical protein [Candidatus Heimdallarchaeota archaeon]